MGKPAATNFISIFGSIGDAFPAPIAITLKQCENCCWGNALALDASSGDDSRVGKRPAFAALFRHSHAHAAETCGHLRAHAGTCGDAGKPRRRSQAEAGQHRSQG